MQLSTLLAAVFLFGTTALASPYPWAAPQASLVPTPTSGGNGSRKGNRTRKHRHKEYTPTFKLACDCPKPIVPMDLLTENEKCLMNHAASVACYIGSKGGCPSPAAACGLPTGVF